MAADHDRPRAEPPGRRTGRAAAALAVLLCFLAYAGSFGPWSDGQVLGNDAIHYARAVAAGEWEGLLLANHLLPHLLARGLYLALAGTGAVAAGPEGALAAQQLLSALGGAAGAALVWRAGRRLAEPRAAALAAAAFAAASGTWLYAAVGETYALATAAELWVVLATLRLARGEGSARTAELVAALATATLVRQDAVFVAVVPLVVLGARSLAPVAAAAALSAAGYALAYAATPATVAPLEWLVGVAAQPEWGAGAARPGALVALGVHGLLTLDAIAFGAHRAVQGLVPAALPLAAAAVLVVAALAGARSAAHAAPPRAAAALVVHLLLRAAFFAWFQPSNLEYAAGHLAPLALLLALSCRTPRALALVGVGAALQLASTLLLLVVPMRGDGLARDARRVLDAAPAGALVLWVDPFAELALSRELHARTGDGSAAVELADGAAGADPARAEALAERARRTLARGAPVLVVVDAATALALGLPPAAPPAPLAERLVALRDFDRLPTEGALSVYRLVGEEER